MGAVVSLGGCTASFVSPQGLVVTNHHCAYGAIQLNSTPEKNLIKDGFNAATPGDEVSAGPNARIYALDAIQDVTEQVQAAIAGARPMRSARTRALETIEKQLVAGCEAEAGYRCRLYSFFGGNTYRLFRNLEISDVRLVYAPPGGIGNYGGEIDNWMWPRHTGDFSFYRAYVGKDGKPAAYSPDNVPYQPKHWLKFADKPLGAGDFVMVAGYPGRTSRYALADEFDDTANWTYPTIGGHYKNLVALVAGRRQDRSRHRGEVRQHGARLAERDEELRRPARRLQAHRCRRRASSAEEAAVLAWLRKQGDAGAAALAAHASWSPISAGRAAHSRTRPGSRPVAQHRRAGRGDARCIACRSSAPSPTPSASRATSSATCRRSKAACEQMERRYVPAMDRELQALLAARVHQAAGGAAHRLRSTSGSAATTTKAIKRALDKLAKTKLGNTDERLRLIDRRPRRVREEQGPGDPVRGGGDADGAAAGRGRQDARRRSAGRAPGVPAGAWPTTSKSQGQFVYPDANSSLRITFGNVMGYTKLDGSKQVPFTTARGSRGQGHRRGAVRRAAGAARRDRGEELRRPGRQAPGHGAGELPVRPRHHRRQLRLAGARCATASWSAWRSTATGNR